MSKLRSFFIKNIGLFALASLSLGLAPFSPEPHLWGKLKWVYGGAVGMKPMDWFDLIMHATPWVLLLTSLVLLVVQKIRGTSVTTQ